MENQELKDNIREGINLFQQTTLFVAGYLKCNLKTREKLSSLINEDGKIEDTDVFVLVRYDIPDNECHIGMGQCPSYSIIEI
jgi:hypothetical protein